MNSSTRRIFAFSLIIGLAPLAVLGGEEHRRVAVLFVGHGEPATFEDGTIPVENWDGTPFGPFGTTLGVPAKEQNTNWAALYEEVATALAYQFVDFNGNGIRHEVASFPSGDVPPFFTWKAFIAGTEKEYMAVGNYSPQNDALIAHVENTRVGILGRYPDKYIAFMDASPRISGVIHEIASNRQYDKIVVVPILEANSNHTQEVEKEVREWAAKERPMELVIVEPFFDIPFCKKRMAQGVIEMAKYVADSVPAEVPKENIGVVLVAHGTPYVPPYPEFGYIEGDQYSYQYLFEGDFHKLLTSGLPWDASIGRMEFTHPDVEEAIEALEAQGKSHVLVVPTVFKTTSIHTMWDIAMAAVERPVLPGEGVVTHTRPSGTVVYYTSAGWGDLDRGQQLARTSLRFSAEFGLLELFEDNSEALMPGSTNAVELSGWGSGQPRHGATSTGSTAPGGR